MKTNRLFIFNLLLLCTVLGSCKKFLAEYSQDEIRPSTVSDLNALMFSDAYPYNALIDNFDMLTDDVMCNGVGLGYDNQPIANYAVCLQNGQAQFTFNPQMFEQSQTIPGAAYAYTLYYNKIKGCNVVMDNLDKVSGTAAEKNAIQGQCLFLRAYYYLKLVTLYAQPYNGSGVNPETALGVPLVLSSQVKDGGLPRGSLKQTYDQIETDLLLAAGLLKANYVPPTAFRVGSVTANALLSRFYLYRGLDTDWDKVVTYAGLALAEKPNLTQLNTYFSSGYFNNAGIYAPASQEVIWLYGSNPNTDFTYFAELQSAAPPYVVSTELSQLYDKGDGGTYAGDLRYQAYFNTYSNGGTFPFKTGKAVNNSIYGSKGFRVAELYLNRAEALISRFIKNGNAADRVQALNDINTLRLSRFDTRSTAYTPVDIADGATLQQFYRDERRRELCLEDGHRWVDIKRWRVPVQHTFKALDGTSTTSILPAGSLLYALPIPYTAFTNNSGLAQNPR